LDRFAPMTEFVIETAAAWLFVSGFFWLALCAHRLRVSGPDVTTAILPMAALLGWMGLLRLTTGLLGGRELVPVDLSQLVLAGLPYYALGAGLLILVPLAAVVSRRSTRILVPVLLVSVIGPLILLPLLVHDPTQALSLFSDREPVGVGSTPPPTPITDTGLPGMVYVPEGPFLMGSLNPEQLHPLVAGPFGDERPVRTIYLDGFFIDQYEVTNRDFRRFVEETGYITDAEREGSGEVVGEDGWHTQAGADWKHPMGPRDSIVALDDHPVVQVSWNDAAAYCAWQGKRLPTEAEWEKAARGIDGREYPWGSRFDPTRLNYCPSCDTGVVELTPGPDGFVRTAVVGSCPGGASPYGAHDMAGNVWEWVADWYDPFYYSYAPSTNPRGPERKRAFEGSRSIRGGSWTSEPGKVRTSSRSFDPPTWRAFGAGFRCAVSR